MDGFKAFKLYTAIKLHFTDDSFDVLTNKGHIRGSQAKFEQRRDRSLFERAARKYDDREFIQFVSANCMYGNTDPIYNTSEAEDNYKEYLKRRQSITRVFANDLDIISHSGTAFLDGDNVPSMVQLYLADKITIETLVILDACGDIVSRMKQNNQLSLLLGDTLRRITKSRGFVKYDMAKVRPLYDAFMEDVK